MMGSDGTVSRSSFAYYRGLHCRMAQGSRARTICRIFVHGHVVGLERKRVAGRVW